MSPSVFDRCRFENVKVSLDPPPAGVRFVRCEAVERDPLEIAAERVEWQVDAMVPQEAEARVIDGVAGELPEGATGPVALVFPAGEFALKTTSILGQYRGPLIVRGQGRDATLLRMGNRPQSPLLVVRDATIDLGHSGLFSNGVEVALLERVRLVRWDSGAGGSTAIDPSRGGFILVRESAILDGFGRSPGRGTVANLHSGATLRFERCRFELVGSRFVGSGGTIVVADSVVTGVNEVEAAGDKWKRSVVLTGSTLSLRPADAVRPRQPRSLGELNSGWPSSR